MLVSAQNFTIVDANSMMEIYGSMLITTSMNDLLGKIRQEIGVLVNIVEEEIFEVTRRVFPTLRVVHEHFL